jgi:hypothetical protein
MHLQDRGSALIDSNKAHYGIDLYNIIREQLKSEKLLFLKHLFCALGKNPGLIDGKPSVGSVCTSKRREARCVQEES